MIRQIFQEHQETISLLIEKCTQDVEKAAILCKRALENGHRIFICGNGGSAADAQHIAAEIVGRFVKERKGMPAIALTTDTSILTAVSNDYGFQQVFSRQVEALACPGDVLIGISTSGNSSNVMTALEVAKKIGVFTIAMTGGNGGHMATYCDASIVVPSNVTARVQEAHILIGHTICQVLDEVVVNEKTI